MQRIPYGRQSINQADIDAVAAALRGALITGGEQVAAFEHGICAQTGADHAVAVSNGTAALRLLYQVAGIGPGSRVGVPGITFVATASQVLLLGAEPVLLDVDPVTGLLIPETLAACDRPLDAVVAVHVAGRLCDLPALAEACRARGAILLEDAAHAFGSRWRSGERCGDQRHSLGAAFSFHPVKNITTAEGGAITVANAEWAERLRSLRHHGIVRADFRGPLAASEGGAPWYHEFHEPATNERLSELHAALGVSQLGRLEDFRARRQAIVERYRVELGGLEWLALAPPAPAQEPFWHLCLAHGDWRTLGRDRRELFAAAAAEGIDLQVHYLPLHRQPVLAEWAPAALPGAERFASSAFSLPCFPDLSAADQARVIRCLRGLA